MITIKQITTAVNQRCKTAMAMAGYQNPQCCSFNMEKPPRPGCMTHINSKAVADASGMFTRTVNVAILFFPENDKSPYEELKNMDDCLTRAFLNPLFVDGYCKLPNEAGIRITPEMEYDMLGAEVSYEFDIAEEEIALDTSDEQDMEELIDSYKEESQWQ